MGIFVYKDFMEIEAKSHKLALQVEDGVLEGVKQLSGFENIVERLEKDRAEQTLQHKRLLSLYSQIENRTEWVELQVKVCRLVRSYKLVLSSNLGVYETNWWRNSKANISHVERACTFLVECLSEMDNEAA